MGYCYANDGTGGNSFQVRPEVKGFKMHTLPEKEFRPVAADEILSSEHFPANMQQDFLICNTIGFLGVKQYAVDRDGPADEEGDTVGGTDGKVEQPKPQRRLGEVWGTPVQALPESKDRDFRRQEALL